MMRRSRRQTFFTIASMMSGVKPPPAPTSPAITGESGGIVNTLPPTVTFTATPGATSHKVQWSTDSGFSTVTGETTITMPTVAYEITGLDPKNTYSVRVAGINAGGQGAWSSVVTFDFAYDIRVLYLSPFAFLPLDETSGLTADNKTGGDDGAYAASLALNATTFPDGSGAPLCDDNTDYVDIYPCVDVDFDPLVGTASLWYKVSAAGVWIDGVLRYILQLRADGNNQILFFKLNSANTVSAQYVAGATTDARSFTTSSTDWIHMVLTWDKTTDDEMVLWVNGEKQAASTALGTWAGSLSTTECLIGNRSTNNAGQCAGYLSKFAIWDRKLSDTEITDYLVTVPN